MPAKSPPASSQLTQMNKELRGDMQIDQYVDQAVCFLGRSIVFRLDDSKIRHSRPWIACRTIS
jgi:hypothetical protein